MTQSRYIAWSEHDRCVACGVCMKTCPRDAITIHHGLWSQVDTEKCIGCGKCVKTCPAGVIHRIERNNDEKA